jgi:uncharacterized protein (DUF1330 family)
MPEYCADAYYFFGTLERDNTRRTTNMSYYFIAQVDVRDREAYKAYIKAFLKLFGNYKGEVIVADEAPLLLEGSWPANRTVVIRFDDETEALRWYRSQEYQAAIKLRAANAATNLVLARGLK